MYLLGHIGFTVFLAAMFYLPIGAAVTGVILPDAIDKTIFILGLTPCSRFASHSIFFAPLVGLIAYKLSKRKDLALALSFGAFLHLIEDLNSFVPFLFPLVNYPFVCSDFALYITPFIIFAEIAGTVLIYTTIFKRQFVADLREDLWSKIFKSGFPLLPYVQHKEANHRSAQGKANGNKVKVGRV